MMRAIRSRGAAALLAATALGAVAGSATAAAAPSQGTAPIALRRCAPRGHDDPTRCGTVTIPLDRTGAVPGEVRLRVRVVPPGSGTANGTVVALAGGPGQAATPLAGAIASTLGKLGRTRRIVTFDQRGTGGSGRLDCPALGKAGSPRAVDAAVAGCAAKLGARRTAYTTSASVDDLEAVRQALGADKIALYAVSYGTKVAVAYAARHPQHVSRLVLDSVVPPEATDPFMRTTIGSVRRVLRSACGRCRFTRDAGADVAALGRRLQRGALAGTWYDGRGRPHTVRIGGPRLFSLLLDGDFDPLLRSALPGAVHAAAAGDVAPLARLVGTSRGTTGLDATQDSDALYLATTCEDGGVPWPAGTPVDQRAAAFRQQLAAIPSEQLEPFGAATVRQLGVDLCRTWPESPIAQPPVTPLPDVPTLILSGDEDLRTPRKDAETLAAQLPDATLVKVPETGHSTLSTELGGCAERALLRFFSGARVRQCAVKPSRTLDALAPPPTALGQLRPAGGLPGRAGRTLAAVNTTLETMAVELAYQIVGAMLGTASPSSDGGPVRIGGVRGGSFAIGDSIVLSRYSVVPGVTVSGTIGDGTSVLRIGGRAAAHGTLRFDDRWVTGRVGGRPVRQRTGVLLAGLSGSGGTAVSGAAVLDPRLVRGAAQRQADQLARRLPAGPLATAPAVGRLDRLRGAR
jgi:pimeloyl-ACP methyl ester carboxylesterase